MKNCKSLILGCVFAVLVLPLVGASNASAQNLLVNGDFETGDLTGWEQFGVGENSLLTIQSPDNGPSFGGMNSLYQDNRAEATALGVKQGTGAGSAGPGTYNYSFDLKLDNAGVGAVYFVHIFGEQANGGVLDQVLLGPYFPTPGVWTNYQGMFTASDSDTDFLTMQFEATTGAVVGSVSLYHLDNVYIGPEVPVATETATWGDIKSLYR
ncbi:MAG: carbohydrate binding domain-containing protein [Candidatus Krumholzibacteria bacterium]|nr:carbohydrate binding domain-containing protein [Candidatus Krumholzibacteria bacterium]